MRSRRFLGAVALLAAFAVLASACSRSGSDRGGSAGSTTTTVDESGSGAEPKGPLGSGTSPIHTGIHIEVLSSQPDRVSGDDARIRVSPAPGGRTADLVVRRDGVDVTKELKVVDGSLEGVVKGLVEGNNTLTAKGGDDSTLQRIRAWPLTGPIISGPHLPLLACSTAEHGLGEPTDADCSAPSRVTWRYIDRTGALEDLPSFTTVPADLATKEIDGKQVPLYVRYEQGVIDRSVYEIATIDATPGDADPTGPGWNHRIVYRFGGGGCGATFGQGTSQTTAAEPALLEQGYAVATATFNTSAVQCNDVLSAETTMMVKERIIEELGPPRFTIGEGSGEGAAQLHLLAQNYPELLDGIVAGSPYPDLLTVAATATDCGLLEHYYGTAKGKALTAAQRTAIDGQATDQTCRQAAASIADAMDPTDGCDPKIPKAKIYDPVTNAGGLRCTVWDANRNQLGLDPSTSWALRPLDNIGVQYGLQALQAKDITVDQFLDLNASIGGYDIDGKVVAQREDADPRVIQAAYETGRVSLGGGNQTAIPIIDIDRYDDPTGDPHDRVKVFAMRDRLARSGYAEDAPGFQIWTRDATRVDPKTGGTLDALPVMDQWLTALSTDTRGGGIKTVLQRTRPDAAVDNCLTEHAKEPAGGVGIYDDKGPCRDAFPISSDPRIVAGGPRSSEILKCVTRPVDLTEYRATLSAAQQSRLAQIFPQGVCDWNTAGQGETIPANPDRSYEDADDPARDA